MTTHTPQKQNRKKPSWQGRVTAHTQVARETGGAASCQHLSTHSQELSSREHFEPGLPIRAWLCLTGEASPQLPQMCTHTQCFPLCLVLQKVWACALVLWLMEDKLVNFESYLIPGF
jgi:hypothetical protein